MLTLLSEEPVVQALLLLPGPCDHTWPPPAWLFPPGFDPKDVVEDEMIDGPPVWTSLDTGDQGLLMPGLVLVEVVQGALPPRAGGGAPIEKLEELELVHTLLPPLCVFNIVGAAGDCGEKV